MGKPKITVIGHYGLSLIFDVNRFPVAGETVEAACADTEKGGKGFNQALGAARLGAEVIFITALGDDEVGQSCFKSLDNTDFGGGKPSVTIYRGKMSACGVAINSVDKCSEVVVYSGAIMSMQDEDILRQSDLITNSDLLLVQNEISISALEMAAHVAHQAGVRMVYNPAPARSVPRSIIESAFCITPNETEAALLTGADPSIPLDLNKAFDALHDMGAENVIITIGSAGCAVSDSEGNRYIINPLPVEVVSTTGAGDSFNAALAVALSEGSSMLDAAKFATAVSGLSVSYRGICESLPFRSDVDRIMNNAQICAKTMKEDF